MKVCRVAARCAAWHRNVAHRKRCERTFTVVTCLISLGILPPDWEPPTERLVNVDNINGRSKYARSSADAEMARHASCWTQRL